ncbi:MAG: primase C-terminal domain-containing protein [Bryobacteraceae bacterium]
MTIIYRNIPEELTERPQWLPWRYEDRGGPKPTKVPHTSMGYKADVTDPAHWSRFEVALERSRRPGFCDGIGFVFSHDDPFCGIDLDRIWLSDADEGAAWAMRILEQFTDTYSEVSPSDGGVKIWCRAAAPRSGSWKVESGGIEIYSARRFFTVTGRAGKSRMVTGHQQDVELLIANLDDDHHDHHHGQRAPLIEGMIPHGTQHNTLVSLGGTMWRRGMSPDAILAALLEVNRTQCEKPGPPENIRRIVESMSRWER